MWRAATVSKVIPITCKGSKYLHVDKLKDFQGNLKSLSPEALEKLKRSILKHGFSFPVFIWNDSILDGHQRIFALNELIKDGYSIGNLPVVEIEAEDEKEAAEKLLLINSQYARITDEGIREFIDSYNIDIESIVLDLEIPDIDFSLLEEPDFAPTSEEEQGRLDQLDPKIVVCPHCGEEFDVRQVEVNS